MISKIKKIKGRGIAEVVERGKQFATALAERYRLPFTAKPLSDAEILRLFAASSENDLLEIFREGSRPSLFPGLADKESTVTMLSERFPAEADRIVAIADQICEGHFDLLGIKGLDLGKTPDWHLDAVSGRRSPIVHWSLIDELDPQMSGDKKIVWELNRHQYFTTLGRAYWITGNEKYAETFASHVEDWIEKNPHKLGVNWLSSLEIAFRSMSWLWAIGFFCRSRAFTSDLLLKMLRTLHLNGQHIRNFLSTYSSPNTHLTGEALALYLLGIMLPEFEGYADLEENGYAILMDSLSKQVDEQGVYCEQASMYHRYTADIYAALMLVRQGRGQKADTLHRTRLSGLMNFLSHINQPNSNIPLIGDDDGGRLYFADNENYRDVRPTLALGALLLSDGELKFHAGEASAELLWLAGSAGVKEFDAITISEPKTADHAFSLSGFYCFRTGWHEKADHIVIDCGRHGFMRGAHAHADVLSFAMSAFGEPVFIDSGTFTYAADPEKRDHFRTGPAHNCVAVNGLSSSMPDGVFSWQRAANAEVLEWNVNAEGFAFSGRHDGFEQIGVEYQRDIVFEAGKMAITDRFRTIETASVEIHFILSPEMSANIVAPERVLISKRNGNPLSLIIDTKLGLDTKAGDIGWRIEDRDVSERYGHSVSTQKLVLAAEVSGEAAIVNEVVWTGNGAENRE